MKSQNADYKEVWNKGNVTMIIKGAKPTNVSVVKNENFITYKEKFDQFADKDKGKSQEDVFGIDKAMDSAIQIHYYLEMPNKIIDSNADSVNNNKAEWHMLNSTMIRDVYAKCETPSSLPGAGVFSSVSILLITALILKRGKL